MKIDRFLPDFAITIYFCLAAKILVSNNSSTFLTNPNYCKPLIELK